MEEIAWPLIERLSYKELSKLCLTNKKWETVCQDQEIWKLLYQRDFGKVELDQLIFDWKTEYLLKQNGQVVAFGQNTFGNLGIGVKPNNNVISRPTIISFEKAQGIIQVTPATKFTLFLDSAGKVWISGKNPTSNDNPTFTPVLFPNLPPISSMAVGKNHCLFLDQSQRVWVAGKNKYEQLGLGDQKRRMIPEIIQDLPPIAAISAEKRSSAFLDIHGKVWVSGLPEILPDYFEDPLNHDLSLPVKLNLSHVRQIVAGPYYYAIVSENSNYDEKYLLNLSAHPEAHENQQFRWSLNRKIQIAICNQFATYTHSLLLDPPRFYVKGRNATGRLGFGSQTLYFYEYMINEYLSSVGNASKIATGENHSLILYPEKGVYGFGENRNGQLGADDPNQKGSRIKTLPGVTFINVFAGTNSSFILFQKELPITPKFQEAYSSFLVPDQHQPNLYSDKRGYLFRVV